MRASAVIIQRRWRAVLSGRTTHEQSLMMKVGVKKGNSCVKNYFRKQKTKSKDLTIHLF